MKSTLHSSVAAVFLRAPRPAAPALKLVLLVLLSWPLSGCGQKGPLTLPKDTASAPAPSASAVQK